MAKLNTTYMGLELDNPIIVGANNLMKKMDNIKKMEEAGAGAIVYRSLFEEQVQLEELQLTDEAQEYDERHAEMIDVFPDIHHAGPKAHLYQLEKIRKAISIPLIASLNCINKEVWVEYAKKIEDIGVDGLEINLYSLPYDINIEGGSIKKEHFDIVKQVKQAVSIPVSAKLSFFYTNPLNVIKTMDQSGLAGFVLFNRLFQPDIDISSQKHTRPFNLSSTGDYKLPLRFTGLLYNNINADICASTGIFTGEDVAKMILAGAKAIQCVSTLYKNKISNIGQMKRQLSDWMDNKNYGTLEDFRGKLSKDKVADPFVYQRAQYVDILMNKEPIIKNYTR
ncbi:MAG: dihydroorotate dehydrogenase-like protein [Actinomycetia bacterium]|nr:dihydroorotate dehydrogenase-like protein [Actinomycetes bacterium]